MDKAQEPWNSPCGICRRPIGHIREVTGQVCFGCMGKVTDEKGRRLAFWSTPRRDGHKVTYLDTHEPREGDVCFINGIRCRAIPTQLGGYIFQVQPAPQAG